MSQQLHILQVTKSTAGVAEYVRWLVNGLDPASFTQTVVCLSEGSSEFAAELSQVYGVQAFSLKMNRYRIDPLSDARVAIKLSQIIRAGNYDLIHAHASKPGFLARVAAIGKGVPVIYSPHCFSFHAGTGRIKAGLLAAIENIAANYMTTRIMTVSNGEQTLAQLYRVGKPEQYITVHSGINLAPYEKPIDRLAVRLEIGVPADAQLVGAVGRMSSQKNPLDFIRMAAHVHANLPSTHFVWIGSGPLEQFAHQMANELGISDVFHFLGQRPDVPSLLQVLDCFVLPSLWEGFPIVLLEAMAAGVPVVATDIPGNDEAIHSGENGLLVPPKDPEALAKAVLEILNNQQLAEDFRIAGKYRLEKEFTRRAMLDGVENLYRQVNLQQMAASNREVLGRSV